MLTTKEAAEKLGVSPRRVTEMASAGILKAERFGRSWMIDEQAVERRLAQGVRAGRPVLDERDPANLSRHTLMNRDHPVIDFTYNRRTQAVGELRIREGIAWKPLGIGLQDKEPNRFDLAAWINARSIPDVRPHLAEDLQRLGLGSAPELMFSSLGLSLSDQYWFKPADVDIDWHDVNFFENGYAQGKGSVERFGASLAPDRTTPDASTDGMLAKRWVRKGKIDRLLKGGSGNENREPYNEVLATRLLARLLPEEDFVTYELADYHGTICSSCVTMVNASTELIPAQDVLCAFGVTEGRDPYRGYLDALGKLGIDDAKRQIDRMIVVDHLMANFDRHTRNFGIIRNAETLDGYRVAPLFDHGCGFYSRATTKELQLRPYHWVSHPFREYPSQQLALVDDLAWFDPQLLDGFMDDIAEVLGMNPALTEEFIDAVQRQTARQIRTVTDLAAERGFIAAGW